MSPAEPFAPALAGVHVALFTPLRDDDPKRLRNSLDFEKAAAMIDDLLEIGVDGFVPVGTTGQSPTVTAEQHLSFVRFVLERVAGRARVIAGAGSNCTRESVDLVREIQRFAPGTPCLCVTGYYNNPPQRGLVDHFETLADETGAPLVLYNIPARTASYLEPDTLIRLAAHPLIVGVKQGVDFVRPGSHREDTQRVVRETRDLDFAVLSGEDEGFAEILAMGGAGIVTATGNIPEAARLFLAVRAAAVAGDLDGARRLQEEASAFARWVFCRKNPIPLGEIFASPLFRPLVPLSETDGGEDLVRGLWAFLDAKAPSLVRWKRARA